MILVGLDVETTGTRIEAGHRLIQIGISFGEDWTNDIARDVQPVGDINIDAAALDVNRFTLTRIGNAEKQHVVDEQIAATLRKRGFIADSLTPVGFNVGGFDMAFVRRELPQTAIFFSYRTLDLTGVAIMHELRTGKSYRELKQEFHEQIKVRLGCDDRHDALYDARAALVAIDLFKQL